MALFRVFFQQTDESPTKTAEKDKEKEKEKEGKDKDWKEDKGKDNAEKSASKEEGGDLSDIVPLEVSSICGVLGSPG